MYPYLEIHVMKFLHIALTNQCTNNVRYILGLRVARVFVTFVVGNKVTRSNDPLSSVASLHETHLQLFIPPTCQRFFPYN